MSENNICVLLLVAAFIQTAIADCRNTTTRYGDFYHSVYSPNANEFNVCRMTFFPPKGQHNVALMLKIIHVSYANGSSEAILGPDGHIIPYMKRNFFGAKFPAWCGVYINDPTTQSSCAPDTILTDSCSTLSTMSSQWPPTLQIYSMNQLQLLMTYSYINCPVASDEPVTPVFTGSTVSNAPATKIPSSANKDFALNKLSIMLLALLLITAIGFVIFMAVSFNRRSRLRKPVIYTPPMRRAKARAANKRGRLNSNSNELVSSTSFSFAAHSRSETLPQVVENQLYLSMDPGLKQ